MSGFRTVSIARSRGENRFYNPPHIRKQQLLRRQQEEEERKQRQKQEQEQQERQRLEKMDCLEKSDECESISISNCTVSSSEPTNLDRFLEYTTPVVTAQYLPKVIADYYYYFTICVN